MDAERAQDLDLARRVAAGDEAALRVLYARHADLLFAFITHRLDGARPDAEEVWQDTLLAAIEKLSTYRGQSRLFTWLCGIARHKIADHIRRRGRERGETFSALPPDQLARLMDAGPLPEELLLRCDVRVRVIEALAALPEEYRAALVARYADGQSVTEVAQRLGRTYKATESLLSRARGAFRAAFSAASEEDRDER